VQGYRKGWGDDEKGNGEEGDEDIIVTMENSYGGDA
jgi:hypothetical protein